MTVNIIWMIVPVKLIRWDIKQVILDKCKNQVWIKYKIQISRQNCVETARLKPILSIYIDKIYVSLGLYLQSAFIDCRKSQESSNWEKTKKNAYLIKHF